MNMRSTTYSDHQDATRRLLREKFIVVDDYMKNQDVQVNNSMIHFNIIEKQTQTQKEPWSWYLSIATEM